MRYKWHKLKDFYSTFAFIKTCAMQYEGFLPPKIIWRPLKSSSNMSGIKSADPPPCSIKGTTFSIIITFHTHDLKLAPFELIVILVHMEKVCAQARLLLALSGHTVAILFPHLFLKVASNDRPDLLLLRLGPCLVLTTLRLPVPHLLTLKAPIGLFVD